MKTWKQMAAGLAALACLAWGAAGADDVMQLQIDAYMKLMNGNQYVESNQPEMALESYRAARAGYGRLQAEFPEWQPRVVRYRLTYCDNQIAALERKAHRAAETGGAGDAADAAEGSGEWGNDPLGAVQRQIAELRRKLAAAEGERDRLQGESVKLRAELEEARRELEASADLREEVEELRRVREDQDEALSEMEELTRGSEGEVAGLRAEIERLQGEMDDVGITGEQNDYLRKQAEKRAEELAEEVAQLRAENKRLQKELKKRDAALEKAEKAAGKAAEKAEKAAEKARRQVEAEEAVDAAEPVEDVAEAVEEEVRTVSVPGLYPPRPVPPGMGEEDFVRRLLEAGDTEVALATVHDLRKDGREKELGLGLLEGKALIMLGQYNTALQLLAVLGRENPENADVMADFGAAALGAGEYDLARDALEDALRLDGDVSGECAYNLALIYAQVEPVDLRAAREHYERALEAGVERDEALEAMLE